MLSFTPANVHDSQIDLSISDIVCYRNKRYFGSECKGINGITDSSVIGHKLPMQSFLRNLRISRIRTLMGHPYAFMKRMFRFAYKMVATV